MELPAREVLGVIYALIDPRDNRVRYIGKTVRPKTRYTEHLKDTHFTHKTNWIASLAMHDVKPEMRILLECPASELDEQERKHIADAIAAGTALTNCPHAGPNTIQPLDEASRNRKRQDRDSESVYSTDSDEPLDESEYPTITEEEADKLLAVEDWLDAQQPEDA